MADVFDKNYVYQVARIKAFELALFDAQSINNLCSFTSVDELISFLKGKDFGSANDKTVRDLLKSERKKLWTSIDEMVSDRSVFDIFRLRNDYNNIKAIIKGSNIDTDVPETLIEETTLDLDFVKECIREKKYSLLKDDLIEPVAKAHDAYIRYADAQVVDIIIDKACLIAIMKAKSKTNVDMLKMYAETMVATSDINITHRAILTKKDKKFLEDALVECDTLDKMMLIDSAEKGMDAFYDYLQNTDYGDGVALLKDSPLSFSKWLNDRIVENMKNELYNSFGLGPIAAYIVARENDIKNVKMIAACIENGIEVDKMRERLCETYV